MVYPAAEGSRFGMLVRKANPLVERTFVNDGVGIQDEDVVAAAQANSNVVALREAQVRAVFTDANLGIGVAYGAYRAIRRAVVRHNYLEIRHPGRLENRPQAVLDDRFIVPANDDDGEFHLSTDRAEPLFA